MRTSRIRTAALATVTAALALGLTACGGGDGDSKASAGEKTAATAQSRPASNEDGKGGTEQANSAPDKASAGSEEVASKGARVGAQQCVGDEMLVTAVHRFAGQQGDHLLLTASNQGSKPCWVTSYPAVRLGDDSLELPHSKKDNPGGDKRITLQPGGKVYSAVNLFDYNSRHQTAQGLAIALRGADGHESPYYSVVMKGQKQQFSWNEADVLNWNTEKPYDF
ncbi:DUF4232 domain-containing protein [Streptomyces sparsogenes]|uniref:DUF4232 domain-containing protein n=1 Tax=Streptomyces sparsogenes DSM 40356 TaxID=1331668 RepID=A0A1R1SSL2_9ACTN|nr:DUF4232 domain-containing protein [Streptomyces sparsogenes]OMI41197.1 hypothetical protein SPAR_01996 [Streptomyces sparsogenes DSM 40356]